MAVEQITIDLIFSFAFWTSLLFDMFINTYWGTKLCQVLVQALEVKVLKKKMTVHALENPQFY